MLVLSRLIAMLSAGLFLLNCGGGGGSGSPRTDAEADALIVMADDLLLSVRKDLLLSSASERQKTAVEDLIYDSKLVLMRLAADINDRDAMHVLHRIAGLFKEQQALVYDEQRLLDYTGGLNRLLARLAEIHGVDLEGIEWELLRVNFDGGLAPFKNFSVGSGWTTDKAMEDSFAKVNGYDKNAWLLSPTFDLSAVRKPAVSIRHTVIINENSDSDVPLDRINILGTVFKAWVSTDFKGGDPRKASWKPLPLDPMPNGIDFHTVVSPLIDLSPYQGKPVTVALQYDMDTAKVGRHYLNWQIENFSLFGAADEFNCCGEDQVLAGTGSNPTTLDLTKSKVIFTRDFNKDAKPDEEAPAKDKMPAGFTAITASGASVNWMLQTIPSGTQVVGASGFFGGSARTGVNWLVSSAFDLKGLKSVRLSVTHGINHAKERIDFTTVHVAKVPRTGGKAPRAADFKDLDWKKIDFQQYPAGDAWTEVASEWFALPADLQGQVVVFGFRYESGNGIAPNWQLLSFSLATDDPQAKNVQPTAIAVKAPPLSGRPPVDGGGVPPVQQGESTLFHHGFAKGMGGFTSVALNTPPNDWKPFTPPGQTQPVVSVSGFVAPPGKHRVGISWLLSPVIDLQKATDGKVAVTQAIKFRTLEQKHLTQVHVAAIDAPGSELKPDSLEWHELKFDQVPAGGDWISVVSEWLPIPAALQGKKIVIGFRYEVIEAAAPGWQVVSVSLVGKGSAGVEGAEDVDAGGEEGGNEPEEDAIDYFFHHDFDAGMAVGGDGGEFKSVALGTPPVDWRLKVTDATSAVPQKAAEINAFVGGNNVPGVTWLVSPLIDLSGKVDAKISVSQAINYLEGQPQLTSIHAVAVDTLAETFDPAVAAWEPLSLAPVPGGTSITDVVESEWLVLPAILQGKTIIVGFRYEATADTAPLWRISEVKVDAP